MSSKDAGTLEAEQQPQGLDVLDPTVLLGLVHTETTFIGSQCVKQRSQLIYINIKYRACSITYSTCGSDAECF